MVPRGSSFGTWYHPERRVLASRVTVGSPLFGKPPSAAEEDLTPHELRSMLAVVDAAVDKAREATARAVMAAEVVTQAAAEEATSEVATTAAAAEAPAAAR